ncbi:MAG: NADH-quinone oxidoreductase subunit F [Peptococcaceae bacterium]|nr:NADH-quinone oxidoreductase subunit F [Peptococcaceae bacterium]
MIKNNEQQKLIEQLNEKFGSDIEVLTKVCSEIIFKISLNQVQDICLFMKENLGFDLISMIGNDEREVEGHFAIYYIFACYRRKYPVVLKAFVEEDKPEFPSITLLIPAAHWYEREIRDMLGIEPIGHPDTRRLVHHSDWPVGLFPLRRDFDPQQVVPRYSGEDQFQRVKGHGIVNIPVGPIHAGIIEPGHFRFSAVGENVINLEAQLFYTHRGLEKQCQDQSVEKALFVSERICAACSLSHSTAYCQAVEKIAGIQAPERARFIRTVALELERLYNHIGDVGNICAGAGFSFGVMHGARLKEEIMKLNEAIFGSRFLRGINIPGGVRWDLETRKKKIILEVLGSVEKDFREVAEIILSNDSYLDRVETTGKLLHKTAYDLHAVGPAARAAGIDQDCRRDLPYAAYDQIKFVIPTYTEGDVLDRINIRVDEIYESIGIIRQALEKMQEGLIRVELKQLPAYQVAVGIVESPRGEIVHFLMTGPNNTVYRYMVRSASYCNWPALLTTVPGNIVPDFPLINKSFELCYACLDR